jgi:class 3 adenylate cyclase
VAGYLDQIEHKWGTGAHLARALDVRAGGPELLRRLGRAERYVAGPAVYTAVVRMGLECDLRDILSSIGVPTLVLHQAGSRFSPVEYSRYLAEHIDGARYAEVPSMIDEPEAVAAAIAEFLTGAQPPPTSERVLATVLFTDIVDSTRRAAALGDRRWRQVLDDYDRLAAEKIIDFRGRHVKSLGDGLLATFDGPARAIRCALAISTAARELGIEIRAGLHTGEIETRTDDVAGIAVHLAARIAALSGPSEVLLSRTVKDLVAGSDLNFEDRGTHSLKGIPDDWQLYAVLP